MAAKLTDITTQYHRFVDNQVLTAQQLNEFIDYFEDQDRLSRVFLSGVGIACGFELKFNAEKPSVTIGQGVGVTTDGDLIKLRQNSKMPGLKSIDLTEIEYTKYKAFEDGFGRYGFFKRTVLVDGKVTEVPIEMFEILPESAQDGIPLSLFSGLKNTSVSSLKNTTLHDLKDSSLFKFGDSSISALSSKVVLLYLEAYGKEADLCTSVDCDNQGIEQVARLRVLLVSKADAAFIAGKDTVYSKHNVAGSIFELPEVAVRRVVLNPTNSSEYNELKRAYFLALTSDSLIGNLSDGITKITSGFKSLLKLDITRETLQTSITALKNLVGKSAYNLPFNIQYRYDCIKDIADTYNELKCHLTELKEECCPDIKSFPKHLMLGQLDEIKSAEKHYRHSFYKSPILNCGTGKIELCRNLVNRLFELINRFQTPVGEIKITPSNKLPELGLKSIPFYYNLQEKLLAAWNFSKTVKNRQNTNLSYHTANLSTAPQIQKPLDFNTDRFDFYRIEGHQGKVYQDVLAELDKLKTTYGLAFDVKALSVNINTENLNVDDYQCEFEDLNVLLRAWTAEQECVLAEISGFFSGFSTAVPGTNVKEPQLDIKRVASSDFLANAPAFKAESAPIITRAASEKTVAGKEVISKSTVYTRSNVIPDNLTIKENALGNVMKVAFDQTVGGSVNDIIAKANTLVTDIVNTDEWKNEPELKSLVIDQSIELMAFTHVLSQKMPGALIDINPTRISTYKLTMDDLCARVKKLKTSYQSTKLSAEMKAFMGILINQLANVCCSGKKLQILLEEVDKRKQDILVRLQLAKFVEKNPGLEHLAGVQPGGTFILVYLNKLPAVKTNVASQLVAARDLTSLLNVSEKLKTVTESKFTDIKNIRNVTDISKAETVLNIDKLTELNISEILAERLSVLDRLIRPVDLPDNTVVADFSLPYMCCSDCAPVNFIIQKPPVSLRLEKDQFCLGKDSSPLLFDVSPVDGVIKVNPPVEGVSVEGVKLFIDPGTFPNEMLGKAIHFTVNEQITQAILIVYRAVQFNFSVPGPPTSQTKITFIPTGDLDGASFAWDFGDGSAISTAQNPTHQYKLPVNKENKVTVSLTVTAPNGVCHNTVSHDITFKLEDTKINLDKLAYCSNDRNQYPFIITPEGAEAKIEGNGVEKDANNRFVFVAANAPVGETAFVLNGSPSGLKVVVNEAPVAKFTTERKGNQVILTNISTGAVSYTWVINGSKIETSDSKPLTIDLSPNSPRESTLILSAISETCGTNTTKEVRIDTAFIRFDLQLEKDKFCLGKDKSPLNIVVAPVGGVVKTVPVVSGVKIDGLKLFIDAETFPKDMIGKAIQFTVNDQSTPATLTVFRNIQVDFAVPSSPASQTNISFTPAGEIEGATFVWNFGDGTPVSTVQNPTHQYKLPVNAENKVTVSLTVTAANGVCSNTVIRDITFISEVPVNTCIDDTISSIAGDARRLPKLEMPNSDFVQQIWASTSELYGGSEQFGKGVLDDTDNFLKGNNNESLVNMFIQLMQDTVNRIVEIDRIKRPEEFNALIQLFVLQLRLFYNILGCQDRETIDKFAEIIKIILNQIIEMLQLLREVDVKLPDSFRTFIEAYTKKVSKIAILAEHLARIKDENLI